jgi:hypothetical protein
MVKNIQTTIFALLLLNLVGLEIINQLMAQDERFLKERLHSENINELDLGIGPIQKEQQMISPNQQSHVGPQYEWDINSDGKSEKIQWVKKNVLDWIILYAHDGTKMWEQKLRPMGKLARVYKMRLVDISKKCRVLMIYYYEGQVEYTQFKAQARIDLLTIDEGDLQNVHYQEGPAFFSEETKARDHYHWKNYFIDMVDLNLDGKKEIRIKYSNTVRVLSYQGKGKWNFL